MSQNLEISINKTVKSRLEEINFQNLGFGKYFTDHMLVADYKDGAWGDVRIEPYGKMEFMPAFSTLHYGQAIFEGIKAEKDANGDVYIFRPSENWQRFNKSAARLQMPAIPEKIFIGGMKQLIAIDKSWIPTGTDEALYIRPFMIATEETLGVKPANSYRFMIILSPVGAYFAKPARIYVEENYTRAAPGGTGMAKAAGNYASSLASSAAAQEKGYDQVLWMDAKEHKYVQEVGAMNIFFVVGDKVLTPDLEDGTILNGITRKSLMHIMREKGLTVEERSISIDELVEAYKAGTLKEVFGAGTAAVITYVKELKYKDFVMEFDISTMKLAQEAKKSLEDIKANRAAENYGWLEKV